MSFPSGFLITPDKNFLSSDIWGLDSSKILCLPGAFWLLAELGCGGSDCTSFELLPPLLCVTAFKLCSCLSFNVVMLQCRGCFCGSDFQFSLWPEGGFLFPFPSWNMGIVDFRLRIPPCSLCVYCKRFPSFALCSLWIVVVACPTDWDH